MGEGTGMTLRDQLEARLNKHFHGPGYIYAGHKENTEECISCGEAAEEALAVFVQWLQDHPGWKIRDE